MVFIRVLQLARSLCGGSVLPIDLGAEPLRSHWVRTEEPQELARKGVYEEKSSLDPETIITPGDRGVKQKCVIGEDATHICWELANRLCTGEDESSPQKVRLSR
jgi:hypothetical protein